MQKEQILKLVEESAFCKLNKDGSRIVYVNMGVLSNAIDKLSLPVEAQVIQTLKPLDFVKTPKGQIAMVTETNNGGKQASIWFIGKQNLLGEKNAWWDIDELSVIDSLPHLIAICTAHPFGSGRKDVEQFFGKFV